MADVAKQYEKDAKLKKEDVEGLRIWGEKQPHLPKITELQYILFLQSCYYSNEQAKSAIDNYFTIRTICPEIFSNCNPKDPGVQMAIDVSLVHVLPKLAPSGYKVVYCRLLDTNPDKFIYPDQFKAFDMTLLLALHLDGTNEGIHLTIDAAGTVFGHILKLPPILARTYLYYVQEGLPIRLRDIHVVNAPSWVDKALAILKPMMKKELYDMINIHTTLDSYFKIVPPEILPKEYGGSCDTFKVLAEKTRKALEDHPDFFKHLDSQRVDESKRIEKTKDFNKIFGMDGTFKKLEVD